MWIQRLVHSVSTAEICCETTLGSTKKKKKMVNVVTVDLKAIVKEVVGVRMVVSLCLLMVSKRFGNFKQVLNFIRIF